MLFRDFMQKYRPVYAPEGVAAGSDSAAVAVQPAADVSAASSTVTDASAADAATAPNEIPGASEAPKPDSSPTLLEGATTTEPAEKKEDPAPTDSKPEAKAEPEAKPEGDAAKKDGTADPEATDATATEPPAPIKYEAFKLPDNVKLDDKEIGKFQEVAGKAQIPQDVAQNLLDLYIAERQQDVVSARAEQRRVWDQLNDTWKTELRNDPVLGGNRLETTLSLAKAVVEEYLPAAEVGEYMAHMRNNGMGNYKLHVKLLHNIGKALNVFEDGIVPARPQAPKASKGPGNRGWYDNSINKPA